NNAYQNVAHPLIMQRPGKVVMIKHPAAPLRPNHHRDHVPPQKIGTVGGVSPAPLPPLVRHFDQSDRHLRRAQISQRDRMQHWFRRYIRHPVLPPPYIRTASSTLYLLRAMTSAAPAATIRSRT